MARITQAQAATMATIITNLELRLENAKTAWRLDQGVIDDLKKTIKGMSVRLNATPRAKAPWKAGAGLKAAIAATAAKDAARAAKRAGEAA